MFTHGDVVNGWMKLHKSHIRMWQQCCHTGLVWTTYQQWWLSQIPCPILPLLQCSGTYDMWNTKALLLWVESRVESEHPTSKGSGCCRIHCFALPPASTGLILCDVSGLESSHYWSVSFSDKKIMLHSSNSSLDRLLWSVWAFEVRVWFVFKPILGGGDGMRDCRAPVLLWCCLVQHPSKMHRRHWSLRTGAVLQWLLGQLRILCSC